MEYNREQLVKAISQYNDEFIEEPNNFSEITDAENDAELQVDKLLSFIK